MLHEKTNAVISLGWKDITLTIAGTEESITLPVMVASKVYDVKVMLAELVGLDNPCKLEFLCKNGCTTVRLRNGSEIQSNVRVKGISSFAKPVQPYPHPFCVIGGGMMGLRQALHYTRQGVNFYLLERHARLGGTAWTQLATSESRLQSESPHYQLSYDGSAGVDSLPRLHDKNYWPTRDQLLAELDEVLDKSGVRPQCHTDSEVTDLQIIPEPPGQHFAWKQYKLELRSAQAKAEDLPAHAEASCLCYYPGNLAVPRRREWPGEDVFRGQIGYAFAGEFQYDRVKGQNAVVLGMGSFAAEAVRVFCEFGGTKVTVIARKHNLTLPRVVSWWMSTSLHGLTSTMVLDAMSPMYRLAGLDPWKSHSVWADPGRTSVSIRQHTRWAISDVLFLALHFGRAEVVTAEVKRFKEGGVVLTNGNLLHGIDHVIKAVGFDGDFSVDKIMGTKLQLGPWPDSDWRRFVFADQTSIDASSFHSFGGLAAGPAAETLCFASLWYHHHPLDAVQLVKGGALPQSHANPDLGTPAYMLEPQAVVATLAVLESTREVADFEAHNKKLKQASMQAAAPVEKFVAAAEESWKHYCKLLAGHSAESPAYPYSTGSVKGLLLQEHQSGDADRPLALCLPNSALSVQPDASAKVGQKFGGGSGIPPMVPNSVVSFEPARAVFAARVRNKSPPSSKKERSDWLAQGYEVKEYLVRRAAPPPSQHGTGKRGGTGGG